MSLFGKVPAFTGTVGNRGGPQIQDPRQYAIEKARYDMQMQMQHGNQNAKKNSKNE